VIDRNANFAQGTDLLLVRHTILVDGQVIYVGDNWSKAHQLFIWQVQGLNLVQVKHIAQKQAVPVYHDPRTIKWDEVS
jgi:hypothetical protein